MKRSSEKSIREQRTDTDSLEYWKELLKTTLDYQRPKTLHRREESPGLLPRWGQGSSQPILASGSKASSPLELCGRRSEALPTYNFLRLPRARGSRGKKVTPEQRYHSGARQRSLDADQGKLAGAMLSQLPPETSLRTLHLLPAPPSRYYQQHYQRSLLGQVYQPPQIKSQQRNTIFKIYQNCLTESQRVLWVRQGHEFHFLHRRNQIIQ